MRVSIFHQANDRACACFAKDVFAVGFYSALTDKEPVGNIFIGEFFFNKLNDFYLAQGQVSFFILFLYLAESAELQNHFFAEVDSSGMNFLYSR